MLSTAQTTSKPKEVELYKKESKELRKELQKVKSELAPLKGAIRRHQEEGVKKDKQIALLMNALSMDNKEVAIQVFYFEVLFDTFFSLSSCKTIAKLLH
jgi:hypothetical protein